MCRLRRQSRIAVILKERKSKGLQKSDRKSGSWSLTPKPWFIYEESHLAIALDERTQASKICISQPKSWQLVLASHIFQCFCNALYC